jgi:hypothetical protein
MLGEVHLNLRRYPQSKRLTANTIGIESDRMAD